MALIHEKLYQSKDISRLNFAAYIEDLVANLFSSYKGNSDKVKLELKIKDILISIDKAIAIGLIINELVSNSLKYGFPGNKEGKIKVNLHSDENERSVLVIGDNGVGFPEGIDYKNTQSLGLQLVNTLVSQLDGKIELVNKEGTEFRIFFLGFDYKYKE